MLLGGKQAGSWTGTSRAEVVDRNLVRIFIGIRWALWVLSNINGREVALEHRDALLFPRGIHRKLLMIAVRLSVASPRSEGVELQ